MWFLNLAKHCRVVHSCNSSLRGNCMLVNHSTTVKKSPSLQKEQLSCFAVGESGDFHLNTVARGSASSPHASCSFAYVSEAVCFKRKQNRIALYCSSRITYISWHGKNKWRREHRAVLPTHRQERAAAYGHYTCNPVILKYSWYGQVTIKEATGQTQSQPYLIRYRT